MVTYADRPWLKNYDEGVPASLKPYPEITMFALLQQAAEEHPKHPAVITDAKLPVAGHLNTKISYRELDELSDAMAAALVDLGLKKGERVAIVMPNVATFVIALFGILKAGGVIAAVNPTYPVRKMRWQLDDNDAVIAVTLDMFYEKVKEAQPGTKVRQVIVSDTADYLPQIAKFLFKRTKAGKSGHQTQLQDDDLWISDVLKQYAGQKPEVTVTPDDLAMIQYTGGTTGVNKGALITHRAMIASVLILKAWTAVDIPGKKPKPLHELATLAALPMFHVFGLVVLVSRAVACAQTTILMPNPRDVDTLVSMIDHYKPGVIGGVPTLYDAIVNHPRVKSGAVTLDSFRIVPCGAAVMHQTLQEAFIAGGGRTLSEGYGMSEMTGATHCNPIGQQNNPGSVGVPLPDVECAVVSLTDGVTEMPIGERGELIFHGPHIMREYHKSPAETDHALRRREDGKLWMYSGDIGYMDDSGYFHLTGRSKNMILIGGFNVYPIQIENVLRSHPAVADARVIGTPHPKKLGEETIKAWVVLNPGHAIKSNDLVNYCREHLAAYEVPRRYDFVQELPPLATNGDSFHFDLVSLLKQNKEIVSL